MLCHGYSRVCCYGCSTGLCNCWYELHIICILYEGDRVEKMKVDIEVYNRGRMGSTDTLKVCYVAGRVKIVNSWVDEGDDGDSDVEEVDIAGADLDSLIQAMKMIQRGWIYEQ